jgi:hypothetical protein
VTTCRAVVNNALRKLGRLGGGREPRTADATDALAALQGLYGSWIAAGAFGRLEDVVPQGTVYTASGCERIIRRADTPLTIELPELVSEASYRDYGRERRGYYGTVITVTTVDQQTIVDVQAAQPMGCVVPPRDGSPVVITDEAGGQTAAWLYDGTIKKWEALDTLQMDNEAPRSAADPEGLAAMLALELADVFGVEVGPATARQASRYQSAMTLRFGMRRQAVPGVYF